MRIFRGLIAFGLAASLLVACGGGGGGGSSSIPGGSSGGSFAQQTSTPAPTPAPTATANAAYTCPTSDGTSSVVRAGTAGEATRQRMHRAPAAAGAGTIAVTYDRTTYQRASAAFTRSEQSAGATLVSAFDYPALGKTIHVLSVPSSQAAGAMSSLRAQSGVLAVGATERRYALTSSAYLVNNAYFKGFGEPAPLYETAISPGQWDMHVIGLENAFGYYNAAGNTAPGGANSNAIGSHNVKLAIIDTGQDTLHPDLQGNVVYQACFITNAAQTAQSTSSYSTDPQGHGTDVSGIAAAVTNPSNPPTTAQGFAGAGGNTGLMAYRVFPTPDDNCANDDSSDPQCGANTTDIASAINDAVNHGASVISMSLGGGGCNAGVDTDPVEGTAVENAIANNVIVVAASGNENNTTAVDAPACDNGVIAVGATSLDDGSPNGSNHNVGTAGNPVEYVAKYSNSATPGTNLHSATAWGIVAPGGDPSSDTDADDLHWVENIWTSTPFDSNFAGGCTDDYPNSTATTPPVDCRVDIAGTSMATPHVAGVAALILAVTYPSTTYRSASAMKTLLCQTAHDIGDAREGCGRLNAYLAIATALHDPNLPPI